MPSPFPGMDPYLEKRYTWQGFHNTLIANIRALLNRVLPEGLYANSEARIYISESEMENRDKYVKPDMIVVRYPNQNRTPGNVAVLEQPGTVSKMDLLTMEADTPVEIGWFPVEEREMFIQILAVGDDERIITTIEVLSPGNKTPGVGRREYLEKRDLILSSETHLVEIDLLRTGQPTVAAPLEQLPEKYANCPYIVSVHRAGAGNFYQTYPCSIRERLPRFRVPLTDNYADVVVDLQAALDRTYDDGGYSRSIRYTLPPEVPLSDADNEWADALLGEKGLRRS